jgi:hypothetical protein
MQASLAQEREKSKETEAALQQMTQSNRYLSLDCI